MTTLTTKNQFTGVAWKIASCLCFAAINGIVRHLTGGSGDTLESALPVYVIIFYQNVIGTLFMIPVILQNGKTSLYTSNPLLHFLRVAFAVGGLGLWYLAVYYLPLAHAVALSFTGPVITVLGAHFFLKEDITINRVMAISICIIGAFILTRPDQVLFNNQTTGYGLAVLLPLGSAVAFAASKLLSRALSCHGESANSLTFYLLVLMVPISAVPAAYEWVSPSMTQYPWLMALGLLGAAAHYTLTRSLEAAEVSFIMPFGYSKIIFSALIGFIAFSETPKSSSLWIGSLIIFMSTWLLILPEKKKISLKTNRI